MSWNVGGRRVTRLLAGLSLLGVSVTYSLSSAAQPASEAYLWQNVRIVGGGYVPGIIFNETEPGLVYARTDIGGAYRQDPATKRWIPLLDWVGWDHWGYTGVASIATDPVDPNRVYLAVGGYTNDWDPHNGAILRSWDRGVTFEENDIVELPFKLGGNMPGRSMGERLAVDPNDNSILFLAAPNEYPSTGSGLWRSSDYGANWYEVPSFPSRGTYAQDPNDTQWNYLNHPPGVVWVTFDPASSSPGTPTQTIYVGVADIGVGGTNPVDNVFRSIDGGATWDPVPGQPRGFMPHHGVLAPTGKLYLPESNNAGPYDGTNGALWYYDTVDDSWHDISPVASADTDNNYFGYGGFAVDRQHPDTIMVTAFNSWWPDTIFWRSTDAGTTWTKVWDWTRYPNRSFRYTQNVSASPWLDLGVPKVQGRPGPEVSPKLGWMVGDFEIDPFDSNTAYYGTGATLYGTTNLEQWDFSNMLIEVMADGIEETAVLDLVSPPGLPLVSALGDIAGFRHDDLSLAPAHNHKNPDWSTSTSLDFAELDPTFMVRVGNGVDGGKSAGYSSDGGASWTPVNNEPAGLTGGGTVAVSADGLRIVWSPAGADVHYSSNTGSAWTPSGGNVPQGARVVSDRVDPLTFYAFADGTMYYSLDGGVSFSAGETLWGSGEAWVARFRAVPGYEGELWLAVGSPDPNPDQLEPDSGLQVSYDGGDSFVLVETTDPLNSVEEAYNVGFGAPKTPGEHPAVYITGKVGGVRGLFRSDDVGLSWIRINNDERQYARAQEVIIGDPNKYGRVYLGTNGRGIIYGDICDTPQAPAPASEGNCNDGLDEDCDGMTDCRDPDCGNAPECAFCGDNECNGAETWCSCPADCGTPPTTESICNDGVDDDCDGDIDCNDANCSADPFCNPQCKDGNCDPGEDMCSCPEDCGTPPSTETSCSDGVDNDCDLATDCADAECVSEPVCQICTPNTMSVESVVVSLGTVKGAAKPGLADVIVIDDCGNPVADAVVSGTFSGDINGTTADDTDGDGVATLNSQDFGGSMKSNGSFTFCVDDVVANLQFQSGEDCASY